MRGELAQLLEQHGSAAGTVAAWAQSSGAARVVLLLDVDGSGEPVVFDAAPGEQLGVSRGEDSWLVEPGEVWTAVPEVQWPRAAPASSIHVHAGSGEIAAPIGAVEELARGVRELARAFGGRSVATVEYPTHDAELPLTFAAREGDPVVVAVGPQHFELPE